MTYSVRISISLLLALIQVPIYVGNIDHFVAFVYILSMHQSQHFQTHNLGKKKKKSTSRDFLFILKNISFLTHPNSDIKLQKIFYYLEAYRKLFQTVVNENPFVKFKFY